MSADAARAPAPGAAPDTGQRERAVDTAESVIVQAPAGSGKTGLLIHRYLALLALARQPEEVLVITFTRKAAEELRSRVLCALAAVDDEPGSEHARALWALAQRARARSRELDWQLDQDPSRLAIHTIDALCARIARRMPWLAGLGGGLSIEPHPEELYARAAGGLLSHLDGAPEDARALAALIEQLDGNLPTVLGLVQDMLARREQWLPLLALGDARPAALRHALERTLREAARQASAVALARIPAECVAPLTALVAEMASLPRPPDSEFAALERWHPAPCADSGELAAWIAVARSLLLGSRAGFRKRGPAAGVLCGASTQRARAIRAQARPLLDRLATAPGLAAALAAVEAFPPLDYDEKEWALVEALFRVLKLALAELTVESAAAGRGDFVEVAGAAIAALGSAECPTDLALRLDYRINHVLVDEFQDTSATHHRLLEALCCGFTPGDGRTLFLVGDPMQSIYRFRQAEVGQFLHCMAGQMGAHPLRTLRLEANFRSRIELVQWFNRTFRAVFPAGDDATRGAVAFSASTPTRAIGDGQGVQVHAWLDDDGTAQAKRVAQLVAELRAVDATARIAVLTRSRAHMAPVIEALEDAGLSHRGVELRPLADAPVVRDLHALTRALLHPLDRVAWLAVVRAPWCGLRLADLHTLMGHDLEAPVLQLLNDRAMISRLDADASERVERLLQALTPVVTNDEDRLLKRRVEAAWLRLGGPACYRARDIRDAETYLELLSELDAQGAGSAVLEWRLAKLYAAPSEDDVDVELMTMHKAKGLEFDHVILPMLERQTRSEAPRLLLWSELALPAGPGLVLAPRPSPGGDSRRYDFVRGVEADKADNETARLLYVACTRARESLHLLCSLNTAADGSLRDPDPRSLLHRLWPELQADVLSQVQVDAASVETGGGALREPVSPELRRVPSGWRRPAVRAPELRTGTAAVVADLEQVRYDWAGRVARHVGSVVHAVLVRVAEEGPAAWVEERILAHRGQFRAQLEQLGLEEGELDPAVQRVCAALGRMLADPRGRWILDPGHRRAVSEFAISGWLDGRLVQAVVDRSFVDEDGLRWIVDYKTGEHAGTGVTAFVEREQQRYAAQLERYARLMARIYPEPVRLGLYFPMMAAWRSWTPSAST